MSRRILLLIPHPDDEVVGCAILSARARAQGAELFGLYLTTGLPAAERQWAGGRRRHGERVARRRSEARAAAARLGISILALNDWPSRELKAHLDAAKAQVADAIAQHGITELWTAAWEGAHQDHDAANALAAVFADRVAVAEFAEYNLMEGRVSTQRFPGAETAPGETIRLTPDERDLKRALLALYASERGNLRHIGTERESLRPLPRRDYRARPHPGKLFRERFHWVPFRHPRIDAEPSDAIAAELAAWLARASGR